jgi:hypothetical protein
VFIRIAKEGSTIGGLMDTIATLVSVSLQYGVPVDSLVRKFEHVRFEPSGMTRNADIPMAKSLVDYIFRYLAMEFVPATAPPTPPSARKRWKPPPRQSPNRSYPPLPVLRGRAGVGAQTFERPQAKKKEGNGHGPRLDPDPSQGFSYDADHGSGLAEQAACPTSNSATAQPHNIAPEVGTNPSAPNLRLAIVADP